MTTTINIKCEGKNVQFSNFDLNTISSTSHILIIGKDCDTKKKLITNILDKYEEPSNTHTSHSAPHPLHDDQFIKNSLIISPTDIHTCYYKDKYPSAKIEHKYSNDLITSFINEKCKSAIVFDECKIAGQHWKNDPVLSDLMYNAKHYKKTLIFTIPFPLNIPPEFRCNFDYIFLLSDDFYSNQKKLYDHYAGMFPTFNMFRQVFLQLTGNDGIMIICNRGTTKELLDKIFWYTANYKINEIIDSDKEYIDESSIIIHITL